MTERIREFLRNRRAEGKDDAPCLVVDLDVVRDNYQAFAKALPDTRVFYAVKANPAPEILKLLAELGSSFDVASKDCCGTWNVPVQPWPFVQSVGFLPVPIVPYFCVQLIVIAFGPDSAEIGTDAVQ